MAVLITGRTYPVKDQLRALGGTWDARAKGWRVPASRAAEARALVAGAPASAPVRSACAGHPAGPEDPMGVTVYCDGSCLPASRPARSRRPGARTGSRYTRFSSGAEVFTNANGRCEDAPCCGCCS